MTSSLFCPLCHSDDNAFYCQDKKRLYHQCQQCELVFVPPEFYLTPEQEKAEYDKHENALDDAGYLQFLSRVSDPLVARLPAGSNGLDFGCGPAPALAKLLSNAGMSMAVYDLYYHPDQGPLQQQYQFVTATEVIEHLADPKTLFEQWLAMLQPNGVLAIMTKRVIDAVRFKSWHYKNDPTHICFYSEATFQFLAKHYRLSLEVVNNDIVFFTKNHGL